MTEDSLERLFFENFTENEHFIEENAGTIIDAIADAKGVSDSDIKSLKILTVLGAGWSTVFEESFEKYSKKVGREIGVHVTAYDNNPTQIKEVNKGSSEKVKFMNLGSENGDIELATILEENIDVLNLSNIPDKLEKHQIDHPIQAIEEVNPPVILFFGGEIGGQPRDTYTETRELLDRKESGYKVEELYTPRSKKIEVPYQAIVSHK